MSGNGPAPRVRIRFSKHGKVRFTSHRDVARIWERALRRAGVGIAYTEGFSPRPKLSFGLALSTGHESEAEYLDVALREAPEPEAVEQLPALLAPALPAGMEVQAATVLQAGADSLQQAVTSCTWYIEIGDVAPDEVAAGVARALAASELLLTRSRKGHTVTDDVRPAILDVRVLGPVTEVVAPL
ncbi:MAG TPA: TIGR03936 family radical SAM-associated protein, partial [Acidimicrobiales bacterium]